ncbi:type VI secretion system lipoprotein TssJ [Salinisphaera sp. Q1T1-3]|uniref:type VI secretion system lipoprotein TssJ n=1 Tax=Salinisphaera sp. Q1T1-3 TaxID=2321229 RepID=UPI00131427E8|nr:type VI secretion system lipoprotein TssJ [Salinisphaera sp. Q1T1-3]
MITKHYRLGVMAFAVFALLAQSACSLLGAREKPDDAPVPIDRFQSEPSPNTTALRIFSSQELNQSRTGQALSVLARLYVLKDYEAFNEADFASFVDADTAKAHLGGDLVTARETMLLPGKKYETYVPTASDGQYLAVVVLFRDADPSRWRAVFKLDRDDPEPITLGVSRCALIATSGHVVEESEAVEQPLTSARCPGN